MDENGREKVQPLIEQLRDPNRSNQALLALLGRGKDAVPALVEFLKSSKPSSLPEPRLLAVDCLSILKGPESLETLITVATESLDNVADPAVRLAEETVASRAARALANFPEPRAREVLLALLEKKPLIGVAEAFEKLKDPLAIPYLISWLEDDFMAEAALPALMKSLAEKHSLHGSETGMSQRRRARILGIVGEMIDDEQVSLIVELLDDPIEEVRFNAARAVLSRGKQPQQERAFATALWLLDSADRYLRASSEELLLAHFDLGAQLIEQTIRERRRAGEPKDQFLPRESTLAILLRIRKKRWGVNRGAPLSDNMQPARERRTRSQAAWLNRNVVGMGVTSLLSDVGHEMITTLLPGFLAVLGVSAAALGAIEGVADSVSSFVKLGSGWLSDRLGQRKPMAVSGYFLTGATSGLFALAHGWPLVLASRTCGWFGRGFRTPLRNAILAGSVPAEARGRAFGLERAGDTIGAIIGPLLAVGLLTHFHDRTAQPDTPFRIVFLVSLVPGLGSGMAFAFLVKETERAPSSTKLWVSLKGLPVAFRRFLWGAGIFGMGDFARTLLILAATQLLSPSQGVAHAAERAGLLYVGHNIFCAAASYPVGAVSDRLGRRDLLVLGYLAGGLSAFGFSAAFLWRFTGIPYLLLLFVLAGISIAVYDALEGALTADLVEEEPLRGTAYGVLGAVNGVGDLVASLAVGLLWTQSPVLAFAYAALLMGLGAWVLWRIR
jgi:MFS family permease/HEAT repeat protein